MLANYESLVFDCDGVVLNSNKVKTEAFYQATLPYGEAAAEAMVDYHVANGGVSRYKKFAYFLEQIAPNILPSYAEQQVSNLEALLQAYAGYVREGLLSCEVAPGLEALRQQTPNARWLIVSGGDQAELRDVFSQRGIAAWFDGGIFGSPDTKDEILARELASGNIQQPALFLGDSKYDYQAASAAGLDFVFLSGWSDISNSDEWIANKKISYIINIKSLLDGFSYMLSGL
ncbi:HAD family hydrolase [Alkalispirochaeta sphaeroplastigenens]|uniref:phosphoglycolate phosphatase n=1 Tax=Alkalispirochaeta sphaeroplastigenens TaxID=1187066 RepID=A0A2S4JFQ9_9SPIO|nr:HAD family hydrolase [Alkalispirochaeta sphaeroplastigenens]POQ98346.1 HAD family hydrolase [Alkalispirochaeta sphaeroplastigenens]